MRDQPLKNQIDVSRLLQTFLLVFTLPFEELALFLVQDLIGEQVIWVDCGSIGRQEAASGLG